MKKLKAIIVDDEPRSITALKWELENFNEEVQVIATSTSPQEALSVITETTPDVLFLDIEMPGMNGFELLSRLQPVNYHVVFTTAFDHFAVKAFEYSALDYLLKPVSEEALERTLHKIGKSDELNLFQRKVESLMRNLKLRDPGLAQIVIPTMEGLEFLELNEIMRCESDGNYTRFFMSNNEQHYVAKTLKQIEQLIDDASFFRVHNSHLINLRYAKKYRKGKAGSLELKDGTVVPVSRSRKGGFLDSL